MFAEYANTYRQMAEQCLAYAAEAAHAEAEAAWLALAGEWERLAKEAEKLAAASRNPQQKT